MSTTTDIQITLEDLTFLSIEVDNYFPASDMGYSNEKWMEGLIKENSGNLNEAFWDLIGSYIHAMPKDVARDRMYSFAFEMPLSEMLLHINESTKDPAWMTILARWRLRRGV